VSVISEPAGSHCSAGGQRIDVGLDDGHAGGTARDGMLDSGEVRTSSYVCNGVDGFTTLVAVIMEAAGLNCPAGGQKITTGLDDGHGGAIARDGILQSSEITSTSYVCHGNNGSDGGAAHNSLLRFTAEPVGTHCAQGGTRVDAGIDDGRNGSAADDGILQDGEIASTAYVCRAADGASGFNALAALSIVARGTTCAAGGVLVNIGLDNGDGSGVARDGVLQTGEVDSTAVICNGVAGDAGANGTNGYSSLLTVTPVDPGADCATGGQHLQGGLDDGRAGGIAGDGILQSGEITVDKFVCNGIDPFCKATPGVVDQAQLSSPGDYFVLSSSQEPVGQTFVAGASGQLTGVEVSLHLCNPTTDTTATVVLSVSDASGTPIATGSVLVSQLDCSGPGLDANSITGVFFDLTGSCAQVLVGESLSFSMTLANLANATCDPGTHRCSNTNNFCFGDFMCSFSLNANSAPDDYAAGALTVQGSPQSEDLAFKTFVR
jgi:hypothetical protein